MPLSRQHKLTMNIERVVITTLSLLLALSVNASTDTLAIPDNIRLPRDTATRRLLLADLNTLLAHTSATDSTNPMVMPSDALEMSALLDEVKGIRASNKYKDDNFYKAYLTNATMLDDSSYLIQVSYTGVNDGTPLCRASFTFYAKKSDAHFYFFSPLRLNTQLWKSRKINNTTVYYKKEINTKKARAYFDMIARYDKRLGVAEPQTDFYCADNFHEAMQLAGIDYKSDYNGYTHNTLGAKNKEHQLSVNGTLTSAFTRFDPHDLWHERLHNVLSTKVINRPVDEGTAYLYGGSWGLSWEEILSRFKLYASANPDADWLALYNESRNFDEKGKYPLNTDFVINALIIKKTEREKGFAAVMQLLSCGKKEPGNENYFSALETITGISKADFNKHVWDLIASE